MRHKGATWLNVVNDQVMGLDGVVVPGTLRDSLYILDAIPARDGGPKPETVITDTASDSDIVFGLFAICGYQFSPRIADISDARLWRTKAAADYGPLQPVSNHPIRLDRIRAHRGVPAEAGQCEAVICLPGYPHQTKLSALSPMSTVSGSTTWPAGPGPPLSSCTAGRSAGSSGGR